MSQLPTEEQDQMALIEWFDLQYPTLIGRLAASAGGAWMKMRTACRQKAAGNRKGFPDLNLLNRGVRVRSAQGHGDRRERQGDHLQPPCVRSWCERHSP
ncbi:hypothetical protein [Pseudomonas sp. 2FE]|uniref:hypothetical protein n=1 Tax=Pseudomonas sp. 2FE TaxID=2502190 RepID=UPI0010F7C323|nr:hypothetical protein [Pseudomonas sp. 2FE]